MAAQDQGLRTNWIYDTRLTKSRYRQNVCMEKRDETVDYIASECKELAQNEYKKTGHDKVAAILHWKICSNYNISLDMKLYEHFVEKEKRLIENERVKLWWDFPIQTAKRLDQNRPDIVLLDKEKKSCYIVDRDDKDSHCVLGVAAFEFSPSHRDTFINTRGTV